MRVVGGRLRHRVIQMTNLETTRETQDKVREAIFNMIGPYFDGGVCLDLFAGSGAMGIEAYSRGMEEIVLNDINPMAIKVCQENCKALNIESVRFTALDYKEFIKECSMSFDLVILDPPYRMNDIAQILEEVGDLVADNGLLVFEMGKESVYPASLGKLVSIKDKCYGIKRVIIYRKG